MARPHPCDKPAMRSCRSGFTLIEVLVAIGIIGVLIGILVPAVTDVRRQGRDAVCANNLRQLGIALISYAGASNGSFPPNASDSGQFWYLKPILGPYLTAPREVGRAGEVPAGADAAVGLAGGVFVCPNDLEDAGRSYSMNLYASGGVRPGLQKLLSGPQSPGQLFKFRATGGSNLLLLLETWTELPVKGTSDPVVHTAQAIVGVLGKPGERFGGNQGIGWKTPADATPGRFPDRDSQITFYRHDPTIRMESAQGRCNFAFADGHVQMMRQGELLVRDRESSFVAMWSAIDREVESRPVP